jgi:hypothetical protein
MFPFIHILCAGVLGPNAASSALLYKSFFPTVMSRWWAIAVQGVKQVTKPKCLGTLEVKWSEFCMVSRVKNQVLCNFFTPAVAMLWCLPCACMLAACGKAHSCYYPKRQDCGDGARPCGGPLQVLFLSVVFRRLVSWRERNIDRCMHCVPVPWVTIRNADACAFCPISVLKLCCGT